MAQLKSYTGLLALLSALERRPLTRSGRGFGTRRTNNWQTLDLHHYVVLYPTFQGATTLDGDCLPNHVDPVEFSEVSDVQLELSVGYWRNARRRAHRIENALATVAKAYMDESHLAKAKRSPRFEFAVRLFDALSYFRRSQTPSSRAYGQVLSLATAFEILLLDARFQDIAARIQGRVASALRGVPGKNGFADAAFAIYKARNELVHGGVATSAADLAKSREAFAHCFVRIASKFAATTVATRQTPVLALLKLIDPGAE